MARGLGGGQDGAGAGHPPRRPTIVRAPRSRHGPCLRQGQEAKGAVELGLGQAGRVAGDGLPHLATRNGRAQWASAAAWRGVRQPSIQPLLNAASHLPSPCPTPRLEQGGLGQAGPAEECDCLRPAHRAVAVGVGDAEPLLKQLLVARHGGRWRGAGTLRRAGVPVER